MGQEINYRNREQWFETSPFLIHNTGFIEVASPTGRTRRRKHIDIKYQDLNHAMIESTIKFHSVPSKNNIADVLPKPLLPWRNQLVAHAARDRNMLFSSSADSCKHKGVRTVVRIFFAFVVNAMVPH